MQTNALERILTGQELSKQQLGGGGQKEYCFSRYSVLIDIHGPYQKK